MGITKNISPEEIDLFLGCFFNSCFTNPAFWLGIFKFICYCEGGGQGFGALLKIAHPL